MRFYKIFGFSVFAGLSVSSASASPWADAGDALLRSDIEVLAASGAIDTVTTHWPLPWDSLAAKLSGDLNVLPASVRASARRVRAAADSHRTESGFQASIAWDATNLPSVVRGFDALGRQHIQSQAVIEYSGGSTFIRLAAGAQSRGFGDGQTLVFDTSYVAQKIGGIVVYGGYLPHWWGPGWISALSLSTNARPVPQIGIARSTTAPFESPWLSWIGPWHGEYMVGVLDGPRVSENTLYSGIRFTLNPLPGLEVGFARTHMFCGKGHPCKPIAGYFDTTNNPRVPNYVNDEGLIDVRYTSRLGGIPFAVYAQAMNEDSNSIEYSGSSHLFGATTWLPVRDGSLRLTLEYADTIATANIFDFGNNFIHFSFHGFAYNNGDYVDGMRYRGKTLGMSLDSDSRLATIQAAYVDASDYSYTLSYHRAQISTPENTWGNIVTTAPVTINMLEARMKFPFKRVDLQIGARLQDDQPRPARGATAAFEISAAYKL